MVLSAIGQSSSGLTGGEPPPRSLTVRTSAAADSTSNRQLTWAAFDHFKHLDDFAPVDAVNESLLLADPVRSARHPKRPHNSGISKGCMFCRAEKLPHVLWWTSNIC